MENTSTLNKNFGIVITGGSRGIGAATVKLLSAYSENIFVIDKVEPSYTLDNVKFFKCDISNYNNLLETFEKITKISKIGYLFCNAGIIEFGTLETTQPEQIVEIVNVNLLGTIFTLKAAIPHMKLNQFGKIVLMGSDQAFVGKKNMAIYGATKGSIAQLTKSTALEYAKNNILVNCVCPGTIETDNYHQSINDMAQKHNLDPNVLHERTTKLTPMNRNGQSTEVASIVHFLFSDRSSFMTGSLIPVDGGYTAQ